MEAIGVTCLKKCWRICSDHFTSNCFHEQNGYNNSKRRLLPNAVPKMAVTMPLVDATNTITNIDASRHNTVCSEVEENSSNYAISEKESINERSSRTSLSPKIHDTTTVKETHAEPESDISSTAAKNATSQLKR